MPEPSPRDESHNTPPPNVGSDSHTKHTVGDGTYRVGHYMNPPVSDKSLREHHPYSRWNERKIIWGFPSIFETSHPGVSASIDNFSAIFTGFASQNKDIAMRWMMFWQSPAFVAHRELDLQVIPPQTWAQFRPNYNYVISPDLPDESLFARIGQGVEDDITWIDDNVVQPFEDDVGKIVDIVNNGIDDVDKLTKQGLTPLYIAAAVAVGAYIVTQVLVAKVSNK